MPGVHELRARRLVSQPQVCVSLSLIALVPLRATTSALVLAHRNIPESRKYDKRSINRKGKYKDNVREQEQP
eukprot:758605-Hanusia_phi.AAC.1